MTKSVCPEGHEFKMVSKARSSSHTPHREYLHWLCPHTDEVVNTWDYVNGMMHHEIDHLARALGVPTSTDIDVLAAMVDQRAVADGKSVEDTINDLVTAEQDAARERARAADVE